MKLSDLLNEIGEDVDLLTRSDTWLEEQRKNVASELNNIKKEFQTITLAQKIKKSLQQKNLVPFQYFIRDSEGNIKDIIIRILNLPDAITIMMKDNTDTHDKTNTAAQLIVWNNDGYDVKTSKNLRSNYAQG